MEQLTQNVDTLFANMENFAQKEGLIGKAVTQGNKTFLPVISITLGYGGGDTQTKNQSNNGSNGIAGGFGASNNSGTGNMVGGALGLGAKLATDAVIIIDKDNVSMMPLTSSGNVSKMIDKIPQIITNMGSQMSGQQSGNSGTNANTNQNTNQSNG